MQLIPKEDVEQKLFISYLKAKRIFHFAPINENSWGGVVRALLIAKLGKFKGNSLATRIIVSIVNKAKAMGAVAGVSDVVVFLDDKILFVEMKQRPKQLKTKISTAHTKISPEQKEFLSKVNGYKYAEGWVCYGFNEAKELIEREKQNADNGN